MQRKEKEENAVVYALRQVAGEAQCIEVYLVTEGRCFLFFFHYQCKKKNRLKVCGTPSIFTSEIRFSVDSSLVE